VGRPRTSVRRSGSDDDRSRHAGPRHRSGGRHRGAARRRVSLLSRAVLAVVATLLAIGGTVATAAVQTPDVTARRMPVLPSSHHATPTVRRASTSATRAPSPRRTPAVVPPSAQNRRVSPTPRHGDVGLSAGRKVGATATGTTRARSTSPTAAPAPTRTGASPTAPDGTKPGTATGTATGTAKPTGAIDGSTRPGQTVPGHWVLPNPGPYTSCFCARWGTFHDGIDLAGPLGSPILAAGDGTVIRAGPASGFGNWVVIQHSNGDVTIYGHMRIYYVHVGQVVHAGQVIALVGAEGDATGPHLHFGVRLGSFTGPYTDPVPWLAARGVHVGPYTGD
jgi:murein DD-endopeptidase MepM/ murein hydrolase activator NlpD